MNGITFEGPDENVDSTNSADECQERCQTRDYCKLFTWNPNEKTCGMTFGGNGNVRKKNGAISGPKYCENEELGTNESNWCKYI